MADTYKIGEAATLLNLKAYVLRFWETEFPDIVPLRTAKGQRLYTGEHLALLARIRYLLHDRGLTISGARKVLAEEKERGLVYAFEGAQPGQEPGSGAVAGDSSPADPPSDPPPAVTSGPVPADSPIDPYYETEQISPDPPAWTRGRGKVMHRPGQYHLPGVEKNFSELAPLPDGLMTGDSVTTGFYLGGEESAAPGAPHPPPLFRTANAETVAARSPAPAFVRSGTAAPAGNADNGGELRQALAARDAAVDALRTKSESFRTEMLDILGELEGIASLLRG